VAAMPLKNMENEIENGDSLNAETDEQELESDSSLEDVSALKEKVDELSGKNRQLFERAKKAEGFEKNNEGHWVKTQRPDLLPKPQSNEPDYAKIAFLETKGFNHPDDQKWIQDEANRLKLPLTDILQMEHAKSKLQIAKDQRESQAGMPKGRGSASGKTQNDIDYWLAKGETPDDQELGQKVIEARIQKEKQGSKFSDELYTG
jgi:hypothetical protein